MKTLKEYLIEDRFTGHLEHLEDLVFNDGVDGARKGINFLRSLRDMLAGNSSTKTGVSVKFDGSPAIFVGVDPSDNKFFVSTKGIFNKTPNVYKTPQEITDKLSGDLATKVLTAFNEFKKLGIKSGVYQGDLMFTQDSIKNINIEGIKYTTFHPNTLVYAIPYEDPEAARVRSAKIGVVWHTVYTGNSFDNMKAFYGQDIVKNFKPSPSVWMVDAVYHDYSGTATFTKSETAELTDLLSQAGKLFHEIDGRALDAIKANADLLLLIKTFNNSKIRANQPITDLNKHVSDLFHYIYDRHQQNIDDKKTPKGKEKATQQRKDTLEWFSKFQRGDLIKIYKLSDLLKQVKERVVDKMSQINNIPTFTQTASGFKTAKPEGFCAVDHLSGSVVKLVNRMEFSRANFSDEYVKGFNK
jgi:hypothetical protein